MSVRPFVEQDIPAAADLYWAYLRNRKGSAPPEVWESFKELYFTNPWNGGEYPSLVYESKDGKIVGFLGVLARRMSLRGERIRVAFGGNLVVHPDARSSFAAPRLVEVYMKGDYDLLQADSANNMGRRLLDRMGFRTIPALNVHWAHPLRPAHYVSYYMSRMAGPLSGTANLLAKPFSAVADSMATSLSASPFCPVKSPLHGSEMDIDALLHCLTEFRKGYSLWHEYDAQSLAWLISFMERRPKRGDLRKVVLRDDNQKIVGWYMYYVKPGAIGEVVQIGGDRLRTKQILDHLFQDGLDQGVVGVHGVVDMRRMADFSDKNCFFTCRGGWNLSFSRNRPEVLDTLERGDAFLTRLDGEWCMDPGD
jgi:ribosomal protein S18 acetylase RimI-like enzyme